jgi:hypothetical protein
VPGEDRVARISRRTQPGHLGLMLRYADVLWAPEFQHLVQRSDRNGQLGHATSVRARAQSVAHHTFEAADARFDQRASDSLTTSAMPCGRVRRSVAGGRLAASGPSLLSDSARRWTVVERLRKRRDDA